MCQAVEKRLFFSMLWKLPTNRRESNIFARRGWHCEITCPNDFLCSFGSRFFVILHRFFSTSHGGISSPLIHGLSLTGSTITNTNYSLWG